jgi:HSP20 family protein
MELFGTRFDPIREMKEIGDRMTRLFGPGSPALPEFLRRTGMFPPINVWEAGDDYQIEADIPGLRLEDVEVLVRDREVTLKGDRKAPVAEGKTWLNRERPEGSFHRTITLPAPVEAAQVEASLVNGVLTVRLPKSESVRPRRIAVQGPAFARTPSAQDWGGSPACPPST